MANSTISFEVEVPTTVIESGTPIPTVTKITVTQTRGADGNVQPIRVYGIATEIAPPSDKGLSNINPATITAATSPQSAAATPSTTPNEATQASVTSSNTSSTPKPTASSAGSLNPNGNSTTESIPNRGQSSNNISSGAAAGIGVGCAIAGALIAAAIFILFFRRRRRRAPARSDAIPLNGFGSVEKTIASPDSIGPAGMIERNLPQPVEDQALGGEMSRLKTAIKNHVQSYYHTNSVKGSVDQVALGVIAMGNMPLIASTLGSLLSNPVTRMTAIRFCITWTVISRIDQNCDPNLSFLPPEVATCLLSISSTRDDPSTKPGFMSRWRAFTAALLQDRYGATTMTASDSRNRNVTEALQALDAVLYPFADEQRDNRERLQKLEEILKRSARFGFTLFSQPSLLEFDWNTPPSAGRGTLVVSPALAQVTDDNGRRLPRARVLEEQDIARGLESYL
ncbi:MAG: hypothetical protein Q9215_003597 [Flavoplaca cf. flavocitrina]